MRGTRRKEPLLPLAPGRQDFWLPSPPLLDVLVKDEDDPRAAPILEAQGGVLETAPGRKLDATRNVGGRRRLARGRHALGEGGSHEADGLKRVRHRPSIR